VYRFVGRLGHRSSHRIQVNVHRTSQQACFIDNPLSFETSFPKAAGTIFLFIGQSRDGFTESTHEPRDIRQTISNLSHPLRIASQRPHIILSRFRQLFIQPPTGKNSQPPQRSFFIRPCRNHIGPIAQDEVKMIRKHRVGKDIDAKNRS
jgi:hypothetical protein